MGNVIIIKNKNDQINNHAMESYSKQEKRFYNSRPSNKECIREIKEQLETQDNKNVLILLLSYTETFEGKEIKEMFIGDEVGITNKSNIGYTMRIHYEAPGQKRTIQSIIDKIDLDLTEDFPDFYYVMKSNMEALYQELQERIEAKKDESQKFLNKQAKKTNGDIYKMCPLAQKDYQVIRVYQESVQEGEKTEYQKDRERVVNSEAFRRMVDKAQIFSADKGDYFRTRMTHTLEVNQIAKAIAYALGLNIDLTEAIALGHDLGHTPFGHQGERTLDDILCGKVEVGIVRPNNKKGFGESRCFGGFKHNYQSAKIITNIEEKYIEYSGLNTSVQVVEGVLKHTKLKPEDIEISDFVPKEYLEKMIIKDESNKMQMCATLEGQVVAVADEIAQRGHDVDDALTSGVMSISELMDRLKILKCNDLYKIIEEELSEIGKVYLKNDSNKLKIARIVACIVQYFVDDVINESRKKIEEYLENEKNSKDITMKNQELFIQLSGKVKSVNSYLEKVVQKKVICNTEVARADYNAGVVIQTLFRKYYENPRLLHTGTVRKIFLETLKHSDKRVADSAVNIGDASVKLANEEIEEMAWAPIDSLWEDLKDARATDEDVVRFEKRKILVRAIVDFIAGMTDGYALEEYEKLK